VASAVQIYYLICYMLQKLRSNIRFYVLSFSVILSILAYLWIEATIAQNTLRIIRLTQAYALISLAYLYITLLASPFCLEFKTFPFRAQFIRARRATGVSVFYFGTLHACLAFFGQLKGFGGLGFLASKYLLAISLSFIALLIFLSMAVTAIDRVIKKMTYPKWKLLHRFIYLAGLLVLIHALMLGTHFSDLYGAIPQIFFLAVSFLLFLEGKRIDAYLRKKQAALPSFGPATLVIAGLLITALINYFLPIRGNSGSYSLGIHSAHIKLAQQTQAKSALSERSTRRFTVSFNHSEKVSANHPADLRFQVFDASSGSQVVQFDRVYEKLMHLVIVDSDLHYYAHLHPEQEGNEFFISTSFPKNSLYHLYVDFQPAEASEQQFAFTLPVGPPAQLTSSDLLPDTNLAKYFDEYRITLSHPLPLQADLLSAGEQKLTFTVDYANGNPVRTLKPYLASFGHLVMIRGGTFEYLHIHPTATVTNLQDIGGPNVEFMPLGFYGPIKPGNYRLFLQVNPDNKLILADYTVKVE
jgi:DMSO/TMAO reductase YedYZ heme-binding membrane subunit